VEMAGALSSPAFHRCIFRTRSRGVLGDPLALPDTLWFPFGLSATLSFRLSVAEVPTGGFKGFWAAVAATICFA